MTPFVGQLMLFAGSFAPRGWAFCHGQLMPIAGNDALFSVIGTNYGGDGRTTFALPDLRGRVPLGAGAGPGLTQRPLGQQGGEESVSLTEGQLPSHRHEVLGSLDAGESPSPAGAALATFGTSAPPSGPYRVQAPTEAMHEDMITATGGGAAHPNMQPFTALNWCIALVGIYPSRG